MKQIAKIESIHGSQAIASVSRVSMCGENCSSCKGGCSPTSKRVTVQNSTNANVGDMVVLQTPDKQILLGAALLYLVPITAMITAYFISFSALENEGISILCAFVGLVLVFLPAKHLDNWLQKAGKYKIEAVETLTKR